MLSPKMSSLLDAVLYEAPDQLYIFDRDGRCLYCSHKGARALGEAAQDVVGKTSQELGTRARIMEPVDRLRAEAQETGDAITHEARFSTVDGVRHYGYSLHRIDDPESGDDAVTCTVREVTEQRRTEEALQTERERLLLVADAADVIYRFRLVPDSGFEYVNAAVEEMTGYTPKQHMESPEIAGRIVHPEDHDLVRRLVENPADFAPGPTVVRWVHRDGSTIWTEQYIRPVHDGEGGLVAIEGIARDITQLRETQEQLLAEQSRFQALMNHVPDQIYFKDREHRFTRVNPAVAANARVEDAYGVLGKTDFDFVPERYADQFHAQERAIFETGDPIIGQLERYDTDDGETVWSHVTKVPTRDEAGRVDGLIGINRNVTALMQARASLTRSEARRRALFEASNVAIGMADPDGNIVEANNALHDMLGYAPEDLLGLSYKAVVHPDDRANLERLYGDAVGGKSEGTRSETRYVRKNGSTVWGDRTSAPVRDHNGHLLGVMAVIADITERKRVEEELMEEQRLFHALMSNVPDAIYFKDRDSRFVRVDEAAAHQLGAGHPDETVGKTDFDFLPDARAQSYYAEERELLTTGEPLVGVQRQTLRGDKMAGWAHVTKIPIRDSEGRIEGLLGVNRDITELMEAQEQLRDSEERVRTFAEASFEGIAISDEGRILSVNSQFAEMLGYDEAELVKMQVMDLVAQESRDLVAHERATGGHGPYEHLALRKDGTTFPVEIRARSTIWQGRRARVTAIRDITGRKKAENALRASEARFRAIYEHAPLGISVADATHRIVRANPAYHEITGRGEDELRGMPPSDYTHPDDIAESKRLFAEMMEGKRDRYRSEKRYVRPDGSITWVDRVMTAIRDVDGKLLRAFAMVEDITERRATEALLRKLSRAVEQIGDAVLIADRDGVTEYVNPAFERLTGYAREQAIGDIPPMFSTGGDEVPAGVRLRERLLAGESVSMAVRDRRKNGEFYHAHMVIAPVRGPEGDILHFALTCRDVTDQKQATEALASEANLNAAVADLSRT
ncbi:PAS domain S-box protein, partial [Candidatus Poribacteria bacterium]|nr:PAS domain S-box protein [Candidatus Poribacteria bacterium]